MSVTEPDHISQLKKQILEVQPKLENHDRCYYDAAGPVTISDDEYDILKETFSSWVEEVKTWASDDSVVLSAQIYLDRVGSTPKGVWQKKPHPIPMGSLYKPKERGILGIQSFFAKVQTGI